MKYIGYSQQTNSVHVGWGWVVLNYTEDYLEKKGLAPQAMLGTEDGFIECDLASIEELPGLNIEIAFLPLDKNSQMEGFV